HYSGESISKIKNLAMLNFAFDLPDMLKLARVMWTGDDTLKWKEPTTKIGFRYDFDRYYVTLESRFGSAKNIWHGFGNWFKEIGSNTSKVGRFIMTPFRIETHHQAANPSSPIAKFDTVKIAGDLTLFIQKTRANIKDLQRIKNTISNPKTTESTRELNIGAARGVLEEVRKSLPSGQRDIASVTIQHVFGQSLTSAVVRFDMALSKKLTVQQHVDALDGVLSDYKAFQWLQAPVRQKQWIIGDYMKGSDPMISLEATILKSAKSDLSKARTTAEKLGKNILSKFDEWYVPAHREQTVGGQSSPLRWPVISHQLPEDRRQGTEIQTSQAGMELSMTEERGTKPVVFVNFSSPLLRAKMLIAVPLAAMLFMAPAVVKADKIGFVNTGLPLLNTSISAAPKNGLWTRAIDFVLPAAFAVVYPEDNRQLPEPVFTIEEVRDVMGRVLNSLFDYQGEVVPSKISIVTCRKEQMEETFWSQSIEYLLKQSAFYRRGFTGRFSDKGYADTDQIQFYLDLKNDRQKVFYGKMKGLFEIFGAKVSLVEHAGIRDVQAGAVASNGNGLLPSYLSNAINDILFNSQTGKLGVLSIEAGERRQVYQDGQVEIELAHPTFPESVPGVFIHVYAHGYTAPLAIVRADTEGTIESLGGQIESGVISKDTAARLLKGQKHPLIEGIKKFYGISDMVLPPASLKNLELRERVNSPVTQGYKKDFDRARIACDISSFIQKNQTNINDLQRVRNT
ncbi:MAG: hypothetical protein ABIA67_02810, partial [Candidatus Margulisiibacteriota bacterium]